MKLLSWGANQYGQLAHEGWPVTDQCENPQICDTTGLPDDILDKIIQICGGGGHTLLLDSEGRVWACGLNNRGQCAQEPSSNEAPGNLIHPWCQVDTGSRLIVRIAAGWEHSLALTSEGLLLGWGSNSHGQLGDAGGAWVPVGVAREVRSMSAGLRHSAWITDQRTLQTCGSLGSEQIEIPPALITISVACGQRHSLALVSEDQDEDGQVWGWGDNRHGQLGISPSTLRSSPHMVVAQRVASLRLSELQSGWSHVAGITSDGQVACWGRNTYGQLGASPEKPFAQPLLWPNYKDELEQEHQAVQIALGSEHTLVRLQSGLVLSCGWNEHGNCGTGDTADVTSPVLILQGAVLIGCGAAHCFALVQDN